MIAEDKATVKTRGLILPLLMSSVMLCPTSALSFTADRRAIENKDNSEVCENEDGKYPCPKFRQDKSLERHSPSQVVAPLCFGVPYK